MPQKMLQAVITENRQIQEKARQLNIRAGKEIFKLMTHSEWRDWLVLRLNGARSAMEVIDFESLKLPQLDPKLVQLVITDNPNTVEIEGVTLEIEYGKEYYRETYVRTSVEEEFARKTTVEAVILPSGRTVEIRCSGHSAKSFAELVKKLEKSRIERSWSEARSEHETSYTSDTAKVIGWLDRVGSSIEITRTENGNGDPINGFVGLKKYSGYFKWQIFLADSQEKATEETQKSLEGIMKKAVEENLAVPKEEPWQEKSSGWYVRWSFTDLGNALQGRYEQLVREHAEGLTSNNIEEKIEALKVAMEAAKTEIGGEHESTKAIVEEAKTTLEGKIASLDDKGFVNSEIKEARKLIQEAEEALAVGSYADAKAKSEKVETVWQQAQDRIAQRQARVDGGEILINFETWHRRGGMSGNGDGWVIRPDGSLRDRDSDDVCRYKSDGNYRWNYVNEDELALKWSCGTMRDIAGSSEFIVAKMPVNGLTEAQREAVRRIELEDIGTTENSFGLDPEAAERQAKVIAEAASAFPYCPACGEKLVYDESTYLSMTGEYGIQICQDDHRISRLVNWNKPFDQYTEGRDAQVVASKRTSNGMIEALAYEKWGGWNINLRLRKFAEEELAEHIKETTQDNGNFTFIGGRYFKCTCGCKERVTKSEMRSYKSGGTLEITCSTCSAKGKVSDNTAQDSDETDDQSMESALDALKLKWGSH